MTTNDSSNRCCRCAHDPAPATAVPAVEPPGTDRRAFLGQVGAAAAGTAVLALWQSRAAAAISQYAPQRRPIERKPIAVQPVLTYEIPQRREATGWRNWGGI